jgi:DNA-binding transcriptional regulator PaaX
MKTETIFEIIKQNPGITGAGIYSKLNEQSRAAKWFGKDSLLTALFGISFGSIHVHLMRLENAGKIRGSWIDGPYPRRRIYHLADRP